MAVSSLREFVLDDVELSPGFPTATSSSAAVGSDADEVGWSVPGQARTLRRCWLDTFDWRLYRAGLTLQQVSSGGQTRLMLTGRDGEVMADEQVPAGGAPRWPALLDGLPAGPLRELLEPVAGVRALAPVARAVSKVSELRALNRDAKTVARLAVDRMAVTFPATATAPARLTLVPVRGYQSQADRVGRVLGGLQGVTAGGGSALDIALAAAGRRPGELPGKASAPQLSRGMPAATAMAAILTALLDSLEANVPGTLKDVDTEFLHDLRIAVRWTRSALKLCGDVLPDGLAATFRPEFRWLGDLTTPTRDLDVYLLGYSGMAAGLIGATEDELTAFHDHLERTRAIAQRQLVRGLRSARFAGLLRDWRVALAEVRPVRRRPTVTQLASGRISAANRRVLRAGKLITAASPPQSLHDLRKRCKELRYLVEMFESLHEPARRWQAVKDLKVLQDCLGEFQDADVQRAELRSFAEQMLDEHTAPAATLLAMGEISAGLAVRMHRARVEFDGRFASFASPASQARLSVLTRTTTA